MKFSAVIIALLSIVRLINGRVVPVEKGLASAQLIDGGEATSFLRQEEIGEKAFAPARDTEDIVDPVSALEPEPESPFVRADALKDAQSGGFLRSPDVSTNVLLNTATEVYGTALPTPSSTRHPAVSIDGKTLYISSYQKIYAFDIATRSVTATYQGACPSWCYALLAHTTDPNILFFGDSGNARGMWTFNIQTRQSRQVTTPNAVYIHQCMKKDGTLVYQPNDNFIHVYNTKTDSAGNLPISQSGSINSLQLSGDEEFLYVLTVYNDIDLVRASNGEIVIRKFVTVPSSEGMAIDNERNLLYVGGYNDRMYQVDIATRTVAQMAGGGGSLSGPGNSLGIGSGRKFLSYAPTLDRLFMVTQSSPNQLWELQVPLGPTTEPTARPSFEPTVGPTADPSREPIVHPTAMPTVMPTAMPTALPTLTPTSGPTANPSPEPSADPSPEPSADPSPEPSAGPSPEPSADPSPEPSADPSPEPSADPSPEPSADPSPEPSADPSPEPSADPSPEPSADPSPEPSADPSPEPSADPSPEPSADPSPEPSADPSPEPSADPSPEPSADPSPEPSADPSPEPSADPSPEPSADPSPEPSADPSPEPSADPSPEPSADPSPEPSADPSPEPSADPSPEPSADPSPEPSADPSPEPSADPSPEPSADPSPEPSADPSPEPSADPSPEPSADPSPEPSADPSPEPSADPSPGPSADPSPEPSADPSKTLHSVTVRELCAEGEPLTTLEVFTTTTIISDILLSGDDFCECPQQQQEEEGAPRSSTRALIASLNNSNNKDKNRLIGADGETFSSKKHLTSSLAAGRVIEQPGGGAAGGEGVTANRTFHSVNLQEECAYGEPLTATTVSTTTHIATELLVSGNQFCPCNMEAPSAEPSTVPSTASPSGLPTLAPTVDEYCGCVQPLDGRCFYTPDSEDPTVVFESCFDDSIFTGVRRNTASGKSTWVGSLSVSNYLSDGRFAPEEANGKYCPKVDLYRSYILTLECAPGVSVTTGYTTETSTCLYETVLRGEEFCSCALRSPPCAGEDSTADAGGTASEDSADSKSSSSSGPSVSMSFLIVGALLVAAVGGSAGYLYTRKQKGLGLGLGQQKGKKSLSELFERGNSSNGSINGTNNGTIGVGSASSLHSVVGLSANGSAAWFRAEAEGEVGGRKGDGAGEGSEAALAAVVVGMGAPSQEEEMEGGVAVLF